MEKSSAYYRELVTEYSDMVTELCILHTGNYADAEDCYQNVFFKLYKRLSESDLPNPKAWIITVTLNECRSLLRYRYKRKTADLEEVMLIAEDEREFEFLDIVFRLPPKYRDIIYLYYYQNFSTAEISELTGVKLSTVKSRLKRAREKLKDFLSEEAVL